MTYVKTQLAKYYKEDNLKYNHIKNDVELLANLAHKRFPASWKTLNIDAHITYVLHEDYNAALKLFQEVLTHDPENFQATAFIGAIHKRKLSQSEALKYGFIARQLDPAAAGMWNEIAQIYFSMGDYANMETSVENAINLGHSLGYNFSEPQQTQFYFHSTGRKIPGINLPLLEKTNERFFQRDFKGMTHIYDSVFAATKQTSSEGFYWKSVAYYMLQTPDSLQKYVKLTLADKAYEANGRTFMLYAMIGDKDNAIRALEEYRKDQEHAGQDTWGMALSMRDEVQLLSLLGDYKGATEILLKLNKTYPNFGDYEIIRVSPFFDRIKEEYPPFVDALNKLKLPERIPMEEAIKL